MRSLLVCLALFCSFSLFANPLDNFLGSYSVKSGKCSGDLFPYNDTYTELKTIKLIKYEKGILGNQDQPEYWISLEEEYGCKEEHNISDYRVPSLLGKYHWKIEYKGDENSATYIRTIPSPEIPLEVLNKYQDVFGSAFMIQKYRMIKLTEGYSFSIIRSENNLLDITEILNLNQCDYILQKN